MSFCAITICRNYRGRIKTKKKVSYHYIPNDPVLRSRWVEVIRRSRNEELWKPSKSTVICSDHFREKDFYTVHNNGRIRLKKGAVPSKALFLSSIQSDESNNSDMEADVTSNSENVKNTLKESKIDVLGETNPSSIIRDAQVLSSSSKEALYIITDSHKTDILTSPDNFPTEGSGSLIADTSIKNGIKLEPGSPLAKTYVENGTKIQSGSQLAERLVKSETEEQDFSDIDSVYDSPLEQKLRRQLRRKIVLQKKHTLKIKSLTQKNSRLKRKLRIFKKIIEKLKKMYIH